MLLFVTVLLFSARIDKKIWNTGEVFSTYLEKNTGSVSLLKSIKGTDLQYLSEIQAGVVYQELREHEKLLQALIPIGEEMQMHLYKDIKSNRYYFDIIPIVYKKIEDGVCFTINSSFYQDLNNCTKNPILGYLLKKYYSSVIDFRKLSKGDKVSFVYEQKSRLGKQYGLPNIKASLVKTKGKFKFIFADKNGDFYDNTLKSVTYEETNGETKSLKVKDNNYFARPIKKMRITSKFTYKRWHPILKRYRPHLGVDIGARRGTNIHATYSGKVIHAGWLGGYGKAVKIAHKDGYMSLYAHQSKIFVRQGQYVSRNEVIGQVGSTGRSTAPHLHFGLYKDNKAVNPMMYIEKKTIGKSTKKEKHITKEKIVEIKGAKENKRKMLQLITGATIGKKWKTYERPFDLIRDRPKYEK